jgi:hypothetical protein
LYVGNLAFVFFIAVAEADERWDACQEEFVMPAKAGIHVGLGV